MIVNYFRVWDTDADAWDFGWGVDTPTQAFTDPAHAIDPDRILLIKSVETADNLDNLDPNNFTLEQARTVKCDSIDYRTRQLIGEGFTYSGKTFSLSDAAQLKMSGLNQVRSEAAITYPVKANTIDDQDVYAIPDAATFLAFYLEGVTTLRGHVDSGTELKDQARAAATVAEVEAVVDPR